MNDKKNVAVTGTGSLIGQAIIKSIYRSDLKDKINIIGFDYFEDTVGGFWIDEKYILPDILNLEVSHKEWIEFLIKIIKLRDVKLLFAGVDFELPILAKFKTEIERRTGAVVMVSSTEVIEIADDKYLTYEFLKKNKLLHPFTYLPKDLDYDNINYPVILKPRKGARSKDVHKVNDKITLMKLINEVNNPVIQECVGVDYDEFTCGTIYLNNELKKIIVLRRSLKDGNTFISKYNKDFPKNITEYLKRVVNCLRPFGACNFQLRIDSSGLPKIFEINSRHSGTTYIRSLFGYKEIEYIIKSILFKTEIDFELREGTVVRYFDEFYTKK